MHFFFFLFICFTIFLLKQKKKKDKKKNSLDLYQISRSFFFCVYMCVWGYVTVLCMCVCKFGGKKQLDFFTYKKLSKKKKKKKKKNWVAIGWKKFFLVVLWISSGKKKRVQFISFFFSPKMIIY